MNFQATSRAAVANTILTCLLTFFYLGITFMPHSLFAQEKFSYTKNAWQKLGEENHIKKLGIYSDFEIEFFLKRAEKKPSKNETWAVFGGEGGTIYLQRDDSSGYHKGRMTYAQEELTLTLLADRPYHWQLSSLSDSLYLVMDLEAQSCRLYRTMEVSSSALASQPFREVDLMSFMLDNEDLKRMKIEEKVQPDQRWTAYRIFACFLSAYAFSQIYN